MLSDRFYRILYSLLLIPDIFTTSLNEIMFDLVFFSLKEDSSITRVKAFVKRLLQSALYLDTPLTVTILIFVSKIF
jgi:ribosome biogenesis protein MAK21